MRPALIAPAVLVPVLVPVLLVAGCGGSSAVQSARDVARAAGCGGITATAASTIPAGAASSVTCTVAGHPVRIDWFATESDAQGYRNGGHAVLSLSNWAVTCPSAAADCAAVLSAVRSGHPLGEPDPGSR